VTVFKKKGKKSFKPYCFPFIRQSYLEIKKLIVRFKQRASKFENGKAVFMTDAGCRTVLHFHSAYLKIGL
jgi:hypothetical protein